MKSLDELSERPRLSPHSKPARQHYDLKEGEPGYYQDISGDQISESDDRWLCGCRKKYGAAITRELYGHIFRGLSRNTALVLTDLKQSKYVGIPTGDTHQPLDESDGFRLSANTAAPLWRQMT